MKALSIKSPWSYLIATGIKDIENRTRRTHFRGRVYIHASAHRLSLEPLTDKQFYRLSFERQRLGIGIDTSIVDFFADRPISAIIGEVDIVDCVVDHQSIWAEQNTGATKKTIYNWVLANPVLYDAPVLNVKGALGFWPLKKCFQCSGELKIEQPGKNYWCPKCLEFQQ